MVSTARTARWSFLPALVGLIGCGSRAMSDCPPGLSRCGEACVNLEEDSAHCGGCGQACYTGAPCWGGRCYTSSDPENCGRMGHACGPGQSCVAGTCACGGSTTECAGQCVDTYHDLGNCGACGHRCDLVAGAVCDKGKCVCPDKLTRCSERCVDLMADPGHCGTCFRKCADGEQCSEGTCRARSIVDAGVD